MATVLSQHGWCQAGVEFTRDSILHLQFPQPRHSCFCAVGKGSVVGGLRPQG